MRRERGRRWIEDGTRVGRWRISFDTRNRNRLRPYLFLEGERPDGRCDGCLGVDFGNGNSDPVWTVGTSVVVPRWLVGLAERVERQIDRRWG